MDVREADIAIEDAIDTSEIFDSPIALGIGAGKGEPFPYRLRLPIEGKQKSEWPVATFWLHPLTLGVASLLDEKGIDPNPAITEMGMLMKQNREYSQHLVDKGKGWSNLYRVDGSKWDYEACSKEHDGTKRDPRVQLAELGALFGLLKARCISAAVTINNVAEGNSDSSSDILTEPTDELSGKLNDLSFD